MRLLLDSHSLIWAVDDPSQLGPQALVEMRSKSNDVLISAGSIWELSIKHGLGKLSLSLPYRQWMNQAIADLGAVVLPITVEYADAQATLPHHHRDPFDRLLAAQALLEDIPLVSIDSHFDQYGIQRLW